MGAVDQDVFEGCVFVGGACNQDLVLPEISNTQYQCGADADPSLGLLTRRACAVGLQQGCGVFEGGVRDNLGQVYQNRRMLPTDQPVGKGDGAEPVNAPDVLALGKGCDA